MELEPWPRSGNRSSHSATPGFRAGEKGFFVLSLASLIPLLIGVMTTVAVLQFALRKKLAAQALCVSHGLSLQAALRENLVQLLRLNPQAERLRAQKSKALQALKVAIATANGPAMAAARAALTAIHLQQVALAARQQALLAQARLDRIHAKARLAASVRPMNVKNFSAQEYYVRPLAVDPTPPGDLAPSYKPVAAFSNKQKQKFSFDISMTPGIWRGDWTQETSCEITLNGKESSWHLQIAAGSAP